MPCLALACLESVVCLSKQQTVKHKTQKGHLKNGLPYSIFTNCLGFNCVAIQTLKDSSSQTVGHDVILDDS